MARKNVVKSSQIDEFLVKSCLWTKMFQMDVVWVRVSVWSKIRVGQNDPNNLGSQKNNKLKCKKYVDICQLNRGFWGEWGGKAMRCCCFCMYCQKSFWCNWIILVLYICWLVSRFCHCFAIGESIKVSWISQGETLVGVCVVFM